MSNHLLPAMTRWAGRPFNEPLLSTDERVEVGKQRRRRRRKGGEEGKRREKEREEEERWRLGGEYSFVKHHSRSSRFSLDLFVDGSERVIKESVSG